MVLRSWSTNHWMARVDDEQNGPPRYGRMEFGEGVEDTSHEMGHLDNQTPRAWKRTLWRRTVCRWIGRTRAQTFHPCRVLGVPKVVLVGSRGCLNAASEGNERGGCADGGNRGIRLPPSSVSYLHSSQHSNLTHHRPPKTSLHVQIQLASNSGLNSRHV